MEQRKIDYKKEHKDLYLPKAEPTVADVPNMNFIMVDGKGNPNEEGGEYQQAVELLYALSYTIKMSCKKGGPEGSFDYVVPPLEGLWWLANGTSEDSDFTQKEKYCWTSMIRQPEFVTEKIFRKACGEVERKKRLDVSKARLETFKEGLCVQMMHIGPYDEESASLERIHRFMKEQGYDNAIGDREEDGRIRRHHEIYLGDPRKIEPSGLKTVLRHPIRKPLDSPGTFSFYGESNQ
jgi:hypothetical protein